MARRGALSRSSSRRPSSIWQNENALLAALPASEYNRLLPALQVVPLKLKDVLYKPGEAVRHVYFPGGGFCSVVAVLEDGGMVEVATIGREGMVGMSAAFEGHPAPGLTMVQGETELCYRMSAAGFRAEMQHRGRFYDLMMKFTQAQLGFVMQSTACNAAHSIEQRLARWLLMAHDRMASEKFPLTQEFVAMMLGATRPTVTVVAGTLQKAGLITYRRGLVTVVDRDGLEKASCECYRAATNMLSAVVNPPRRH